MHTSTAISSDKKNFDIFRLVRATILIALALSLPLFLQRYQLGLISSAMILAITAIALNVLMGLAGLVSAGSAALFAVGAYGAAVCTHFGGLPFIPTLLICSGLGAIVGLVVGLPALRVHGIYLAIATLALHYVVIFGLSRLQADAVGPMGFVLPRATLFGYPLRTQGDWYYLILATLILCFWTINNIKQSNVGRAWMLLRESPIAAATQGIPVGRYKLIAFVFSSALTAFAGALFAFYQKNVYIEAFSLELAIQIIAMIVIGGWGSTGGAVAGAFFVFLIPTILTSLPTMFPQSALITGLISRNIGDLQLIVYGGLIIGFLVLEPAGLAGLYKRFVAYVGGKAGGR